ncbi:hypothetical protein VTP01DRAFT_317 [Rhizomucor pusillus]|uniref:uncharacterized protein n=1 Tax=Rhizomucor pusillus TaxID=4840 RepID=UPI0037433D98
MDLRDNLSPVPPPPPPPPEYNTSSSSNSGYRASYRDRSLSPRRRISPPPPPPARRYSRDGGDRYGRDHSDRYGRDNDDRYSRDREDRYSRRDDYYSSRRGSPPPPSYSGSSSRYDRYDRYDDRRYRPYSPYPPRPHPRRPVDRGTEKERRESTTLFVGNLPYSFRERDVAAMFDKYGPIAKVTVPIDSITNKNKGFAFVEFEDRRDAEDAFDKYHGFSVEGRRLKLDWDIGLSKKDEHKSTSRRRSYHDEPRDRPSRSLPSEDPYRRPPPPPPATYEDDSAGYRRDAIDRYRR